VAQLNGLNIQRQNASYLPDITINQNREQLKSFDVPLKQTKEQKAELIANK